MECQNCFLYQKNYYKLASVNRITFDIRPQLSSPQDFFYTYTFYEYRKQSLILMWDLCFCFSIHFIFRNRNYGYIARIQYLHCANIKFNFNYYTLLQKAIKFIIKYNFALKHCNLKVYKTQFIYLVHFISNRKSAIELVVTKTANEDVHPKRACQKLVFLHVLCSL